MEIATIVGIVVGVYLIAFQGIGDPARIAMFIDLHSVAITFGGTISAILVAYPFSTVLSIFTVAKHAFFAPKNREVDVVNVLVSLSEQARREGILSLEHRLESIEDEFLRRGILMAIDGNDPDMIREIMTIELEGIHSRHHNGAQFFEDLGALAPAFGMIGTVIGLVLMLANMSDPSTIGPAMATALITTFYGAVLANLIFIPIAIKLKGFHATEMLAKTMMLEGVMALQNGENPRIVEAKMLAFVSPDARLKAMHPPKKLREAPIG